MTGTDINPGLPKQHGAADIITPDFDEPTKEELLVDLKRALQEALAGEGRPALEVLDEIDREMMDDANSR